MSPRPAADAAGRLPADPRTANMLGALGIGLADLQAAAMTTATTLDVSAVAALTTLLDRPGLTVRQLSQVLGITHSGTVRLADRLASRGLLRRGTGADARQAPLTLTSAGRLGARAALRARRDTLQALLRRLPEAQREPFAEALAAMLGGLPSSVVHARHLCRLCEHASCRSPDCPVGAAVAGQCRGAQA